MPAPSQGDFFADKMITPAVLNGKGVPAVDIGKSSFVFLWEIKILSGREQLERELPFSKPNRQ